MSEPCSFVEQAFGRYRLLSRLGEGGMAEVFKAKSFGVEGFEKIVVIKRILPRLAQYKPFVDMFVHEAKVAVRLSHANVVQVFDLGRVDGAGEAPAYYMAMEYVAGMDLASLLARCRGAGLRPPPGLAVYLTAEVAKGLDHAHRRRDDGNQPLGIVHRDVSPQNILLSWEGEVKVTDFGIAKARDSLEDTADDSRVQVIKGKYSYMSPEQARGEAVDARSDLFSLGTVLYEVLSGSNPFRAAQPTETLRRVRGAEIPPLSLAAPDVPGPLVELVGKIMGPKPADRFEDAARMYEALLSYSYQSGARFGAADLAEFLQQLRQAPAVEALGSQESTPVRVKSPAPSLVIDEPPEAGSVVLLREATALCLGARARSGGGLDTLPHEVRERAAAACRRLGGRLLDEDGEVVALFGLGEADPRDTEHAVRAATATLRACGDLGLRLGVGVHVGKLRVDGGGELLRGGEELDLIDGARGLASEADGRVLLSPDAARQVRGLFALEGAGRGFAVGAPRPAQEAYGKFVGRRGELSRLGTILGNASKRQLQLITVEGAAGVGKTRLLHEIDRRLRRGDFNVGVYVAPCSPRGREAPLSGATAMLQVLCGVQDGDGADRARQVAPSLRALGLLDDEVDAVLAQLGVPGLSPEGPQVLRSAFLKTLMSLAEDRVHVFAWDNAQWLDESSAALLSLAMRRLAGMRVALVLVQREGAEGPLRGAKNHELISLGELPEEEALRLMESRLGVAQLPPDLVEFCLRRAGGHPLFLEEILRDLVDSGAVVVEGAAVTHLDLDKQPAVPRPLRAVMAGRVERLPVAEQLALQTAAVVGEVFEGPLLAELAGPDTPAALASLEQRELLRGASDGAYTFASPLLRDVVLDALPPDARRQLHGRVAAALERAGGSLPRVATHLQEAGKLHEAGLLWARSARRQVAARQHEAAASEGLRALGLLDLQALPVDEALELLRALASALDRVRLAPDAPRLLLGALEDLDPRASPSERVEARVEVARALGAISRFDAALEALAGAPPAGLSPELSQRLRLAEAELHFRRGDFRRSREVLATVDAASLSPQLAPRALVLATQAHAVAGERELALELLARLPASDDPASEAQLDKLRALISFFSRDFNAAAAASVRGAELARQSGLAFEAALHLHNLGDALIFLADYPRAYAALQQSLTLCEERGAARLGLQNRMYLGYLDALQGLPGGEAVLRDGIAHAESQGYLWDIVNGRFLLGRLLEDMGLPRAATAEFEACRALARETHNDLIDQECAAALARVAPLVLALQKSAPAKPGRPRCVRRPCPRFTVNSPPGGPSFPPPKSTSTRPPISGKS